MSSRHLSVDTRHFDSDEPARSRWALTRHKTEVMDLLLQHFESKAGDLSDDVGGPDADSKLLASIRQAQAIENAPHEALRQVLHTRDIAALLADRLGAHSTSQEDATGDGTPEDSPTE